MKVSIITISRNNKNGLLETIESVIKQTFNEYEFIVIDGASNDGSRELIEQYSSNITYWISEPDNGIYHAMNKGIQQAKGEYCYFLNSGDKFVSENVLQNVFSNYKEDYPFICGNLIWDKKGILQTDTEYQTRDWLFSLYDIYSGFLSHQAFLIRKDMFDKYGLYDERFKIMSDWKLFFIAIGIHGEKVEYIDTDIAVYDTEGLSSRIGGAAILKEKRQIAEEELSHQVYAKLDRLYFLERNDFWIDFIYSKKWIHFLSKVFFKICTKLRLTKV